MKHSRSSNNHFHPAGARRPSGFCENCEAVTNTYYCFPCHLDRKRGLIALPDPPGLYVCHAGCGLLILNHKRSIVDRLRRHVRIPWLQFRTWWLGS